MSNAVQQFASDNNAGACPEVMAAINEANEMGHLPSYGDDALTAQACDLVRKIFETDCEVFLVLNGSAANGLAVAAMCRSYHGLICHQGSHVATTECGGAAFFSGGASMIPVSGEHAKISPDAVLEEGNQPADFHIAKPKAVSITQTTELGTVYQLDEIQAITTAAKQFGFWTHMDGARFGNAVASLGASPADVTWRAGIDILSLGGTKNGMPIGEAVVIFDKALAEEFNYRAKQGGQIVSKMRFLSAAWIGMLEDDVWLRNARHANAMAARLVDQIRAIPGIDLAHPTQANAVFAHIDPAIVDQVQAAGWKFFTERHQASRLMCAWDTRPETVDQFAADLAKASREAA